MGSTINPQNYHDKESSRNIAITKKLATFLATFIGATNVPLSLVDNEEFYELLHEMDRKYQVPHRKAVSEEITKTYSHLKAKIRSSLEKAEFVSICADIWSKPGMTASFLGVTAHFFVPDSNTRHSTCIALRRFPSPHTGSRIAELL